jgi:hypothetical protein
LLSFRWTFVTIMLGVHCHSVGCPSLFHVISIRCPSDFRSTFMWFSCDLHAIFVWLPSDVYPIFVRHSCNFCPVSPVQFCPSSLFRPLMSIHHRSYLILYSSNHI